MTEAPLPSAVTPTGPSTAASAPDPGGLGRAFDAPEPGVDLDPDLVVWHGADLLRPNLVPIDDLRTVGDPAGDPARVLEALMALGQIRPVLVAENLADVVGREHLVVAARRLGWTHVAVRWEVSDASIESLDQMSLVDEVAPDDVESQRSLARRSVAIEADDDVIDDINERSADAEAQWVGLPEFFPADAPLKVVVSCETEADRDALFDVLGIATVHKGTRGTLSVWWPERPREDLSSLRFEVAR